MILIALFTWIGITTPAKISAQGDLLITPRRVVFEGTKRSMDLNLANTGRDTATYAISLVQIRMKEDGGFETITEPDPGQRFADRYIRFFPRSVTLGPNEAQTVKIQLIRSNELEQGEYRSHFYFRSIPDIAPLGETEIIKDTTNISVVLTPVFGITIPAIIRVGESTASVSISNPGLEMLNDTIPMFSMIFNRSGICRYSGIFRLIIFQPRGK
jgi:P pilus assembly chaperone PapD